MKNKSILFGMILFPSILGLSGSSNNVSRGNPPQQSHVIHRTNKVPMAKQSEIIVIRPNPSVHPSDNEFLPGGPIDIKGKIQNLNLKDKNPLVKVELFWGYSPIKQHLIKSEWLPVETYRWTNPGEFNGTFWVPLNYHGAGGSKFVLNFSYGNATPINIHLAVQSGSDAPSGYHTFVSRLVQRTYPSTVDALNALIDLQTGDIGNVVMSGQTINLGYGIKAYYTKPGQTPFQYQWQDGRWTILTQFLVGSITPATKNVVKNMVAYLHAHRLPTPQGKGFITAVQAVTSKSADDLITIIAWQVNNHVYELNETGNPVSALRSLVMK